MSRFSGEFPCPHYDFDSADERLTSVSPGQHVSQRRSGSGLSEGASGHASQLGSGREPPYGSMPGRSMQDSSGKVDYSQSGSFEDRNACVTDIHDGASRKSASTCTRNSHCSEVPEEPETSVRRSTLHSRSSHRSGVAAEPEPCVRRSTSNSRNSFRSGVPEDPQPCERPSVRRSARVGSTFQHIDTAEASFERLNTSGGVEVRSAARYSALSEKAINELAVTEQSLKDVEVRLAELSAALDTCSGPEQLFRIKTELAGEVEQRARAVEVEGLDDIKTGPLTSGKTSAYSTKKELMKRLDVVFVEIEMSFKRIEALQVSFQHGQDNGCQHRDEKWKSQTAPNGVKSIVVDMPSVVASSALRSYVVWGFDIQGAFVRVLKQGIPDGHGFVCNDRLLRINGEDVSGLSKEEIKNIWMRCTDSTEDILRLELTPEQS